MLTDVTWLFAPSRDQKGSGGRTSEARAWVGQGNSKLRRKLQVPGQGGSVMDTPPQKPQRGYTSANTHPSSRLEPSEAGGGVGSCLTCGCPHLPGDLPKARWDSDWGHLLLEGAHEWDPSLSELWARVPGMLPGASRRDGVAQGPRCMYSPESQHHPPTLSLTPTVGCAPSYSWNHQSGRSSLRERMSSGAEAQNAWEKGQRRGAEATSGIRVTEVRPAEWPTDRARGSPSPPA